MAHLLFEAQTSLCDGSVQADNRLTASTGKIAHSLSKSFPQNAQG
jgi:hypothetical protein